MNDIPAHKITAGLVLAGLVTVTAFMLHSRNLAILAGETGGAANAVSDVTTIAGA